MSHYTGHKAVYPDITYPRDYCGLSYFFTFLVPSTVVRRALFSGYY